MRRHAAALALLVALAPDVGSAHDHPQAARAVPDALCEGAAVREALAVVEAFDAALERGDGAAALALMSEDALVLEQGGAERSRARYAAEHLESDMAFSRATQGAVIRRAGCSAGEVAWIGTESRVRGRFRDKDVDRLTAETMVLRRTRDGWRVVHIHWSSRAAG